MKRRILIMISILSLVFLTGCQSGADDDAIKLWWPSGIVMEQIITDAIADYQVDHPDTKIDVVYKPMDAFDAYKYALNDNKTRPDIAILDHVYVQALAFDGLLANLSDLGSDDLKSSYPEAIYNANTFENDAYALPFSANTVVLMYNKNLLSSVGIDKAPVTLEELLADCETVSQNGYKAFAQPLNDFSVMEFSSYVARHNGKLVSDDYKDVLLDSPEVMAAISDWVKLSKYVNKSSYEEDQFYIGNVAFVEMGSWALSKVTGEVATFDCGFAPMVTLQDGVSNYSGLGLYSLTIAKQTNHTEEAYKFARYLSTNKEVQLAFNQEKNLFPVTLDALQDQYYTGDEALSVYANQLLTVAPRPGTPIWPDLELAIVDMLHSAVLAQQLSDISAIVDRYQNQAQEAADRLFK